jgi:hypothetical protein
MQSEKEEKAIRNEVSLYQDCGCHQALPSRQHSLRHSTSTTLVPPRQIYNEFDKILGTNKNIASHHALMQTKLSIAAALGVYLLRVRLVHNVIFPTVRKSVQEIGGCHHYACEDSMIMTTIALNQELCHQQGLKHSSCAQNHQRTFVFFINYNNLIICALTVASLSPTLPNPSHDFPKK